MTGLRRTTVALAVVAALLAIGGTARAAEREHAPNAGPAACVLGQQLVAGVSAGWTQPGQISGTNFALTNRSTACVVKGTLWAQFHGAKGGSIGPIAAVRSIRSHVVRETFQLVSQVYFSYSYPCAAQVTATRVRIGLDGSSVAVTLKSPEVVCVSRHLSVRVVAPAFPLPPPCTQSQLSLRLGLVNGAAGSIVMPIVVRNVSKAACTVGGFPNVQGVNGPGGAPIGPPAGKIRPRGSGAPVKDLNHTGASASATYELANTGEFTPGRCGPETAPGISVAIMGLPARYLSYRVSVCSKFTSTSVTRIGVPL
jgi:hypothetical protein